MTSVIASFILPFYTFFVNFPLRHKEPIKRREAPTCLHHRRNALEALVEGHCTVREMDSQLAWLAFCVDGRNECVPVMIRKTAYAIYTHSQNDVSYTIII